jgi:hypothetical protein
MTPLEELKKMIEVLERDIESPIYQCNPRVASMSRFATINNYEAFIRKEINEEELKDNNKRIGIVSRTFNDMCLCTKNPRYNK